MSFDTDVAYLRDRGHEVRVLTVDSRLYAERGVRAQALGLIGRDTDLKSETCIRGHQSDVAYLNNWFPWLAPYLEALGNLPVLATVPNYRLWCLNGLFFRSGHVCRSCFSGTRLNGVRHSCYRGFTSSVVALGLVSKASKTLLAKPSVHFAPVSSFLADILIEAGVPSSRIHIKPNMVFPVPAVGGGGRSVLFAGRLDLEKGFDSFITACGFAGVTPVVAGTGSLVDLARERSDYRGALRPAEVEGLMGQSLVTVTPLDLGRAFRAGRRREPRERNSRDHERPGGPSVCRSSRLCHSHGTGRCNQPRFSNTSGSFRCLLVRGGTRGRKGAIHGELRA